MPGYHIMTIEELALIFWYKSKRCIQDLCYYSKRANCIK